MHVAAQFSNEKYLDYLIKAQPNSDWQADFGASLLELAVLNNNKSLIEKLINSGVDINEPNKRGSTALEISQRIGADDVADLILSLGGDNSRVRVFEIAGPHMGQEEWIFPKKLDR